jgi:hypothetical protein
MAYERLDEGQLDYSPCRYGSSKLLFRGPRQDLDDGYLAFLGSTETYGKFVLSPFPALVAQKTGMTAINLGCVNAGVDTYHDDTTVQRICWNARACVVQVMGAHKLSNRFYSVHARRNDRFLGAASLLRRLYPEVDFAEIHFVGHLISTLSAGSDERFALVRKELRRAWAVRMRRLISRIRVPVVLLWAAARAPEEGGNDPAGAEPLFLTREMIEDLRPRVAGFVEVSLSADADDQPPTGMVFPEVELAAARELPGQDAHSEIASAVATALGATL